MVLKTRLLKHKMSMEKSVQALKQLQCSINIEDGKLEDPLSCKNKHCEGEGAYWEGMPYRMCKD